MLEPSLEPTAISPDLMVIDSSINSGINPVVLQDSPATVQIEAGNYLHQDLALLHSSDSGPALSMPLLSPEIDMSCMGSALHQSGPAGSSDNSLTFVYGPGKVGRPRTRPFPDSSLPKRSVGRPAVQSSGPSSSRSRHPPPPLRDPSAPRGPNFTSVTQWLQNQPGGLQLQSTASESVTSSTPPPVRVIVAEPDEDAVVADSDDAEEIGVENPTNSHAEDDEDDDDDESNTGCKSYPEWFSKLLEEKLELVNKQVHGKRVFYAQVQNFWLPQKAAWFNMLQAETLGPEAIYNPRWFYWDPLGLVKIKCPNFMSCQSFLIRNTICKRPRRCVDLDSCFWMIGARYKCSKCHNEKSGKKTVYFMSWDTRIINSLPKALAAEFPITLTHRSAIHTPLLSLQRSLFHKGLGAQQFAKIIHVQHLRRFDFLQIQYLEMIDAMRINSPWKNSTFEAFSAFNDPLGYSGYVPSSRWFRDVYDSYIELHLPRINQYTSMLTGRIVAIDHSHKVTKHIIVVNGVPVFIGLLTVTNEYGEIRVMALVATKSHAQFEVALIRMREALTIYGHTQPELFYTDNLADKGFLEKCFPSLLKDVQPVDKFSKLPLFTMPSEVTIHVKSTATQIQTALATIQEQLIHLPAEKQIVVGLDLEWNVDMTPGHAKQGKTAVISLAHDNHVYVFQIARLHGNHFPVSLRNFLTESRILKVGRGIKGDLQRLQKESGYGTPFTGWIDLAKMAKDCHVAPNARVGLAELCALVLKARLDKDPNIRVSTEWDNIELRKAQVDYAASDAYVALLVYQNLEKIQRLGNVPVNAPPGLLVSIHQQNSQKVIALGTWSSHNSNPDGIINGIRITPLNAAVEIQKIIVPGAVMAEHKCLLSSFGPPPFTVVCKRNQVSSSSIDLELEQCNSESAQTQETDTTCGSTLTGITHNVNNEVMEYDNSWLADVDEELAENAPNFSVPESSTADQESLQQGTLIFVEISKEKDSPAIRSRILKDVWHAFDMILIPKNHGLRIIFARALRDAIFTVNPEDKARVDARLQQEGSSWDEKLKYQPKYLWKLVRRTIPPPEQLYDLVANLFQTYGSLKDSITGQPLFNAAAWKSAKSVLKLVQAGYISDPPGIDLYYQVGLDRKKDGLPVWRCMRGTNFTEGGVHHSIRHAFPDSSISARHAVNRLADFQLHHNLSAGTYNKTGQKFSGHYDIWLYDKLQLLVEKLRTLVPNSHTIKGWTNGTMYAPTNEVFGILPIPEITRIKAAIQPAIPAAVIKKGHWYLALRQGTQYAVIAIHTTEEKQLFSKLMRESPSFNRNNQDPDWKQAVQIWNRDHVDGKTIFYKVC